MRKMESTILAKKNVYFHGIWKAGYRVSDKLVKSIADEIGSKPSRLCTLHLTTAGLTLEVPSTNDGKTRKTDQVAFSSLRDISVNMYQRTCLLIIYVDSSNTFSIMTCSHQEERELEDIANAFRRQKNALLKSVHPETQSPASVNWTLRQNQTASPEGTTGFVRENYLRSSLSNGVGHKVVNNDEALSKERHTVNNRNSTNFSTQSIAMNDYTNDDDVFAVSRPIVVHEPEHLTRIPVEGSHHGHSDAFNVEVQTAAYEEDFDVESITSAISQMSSIKSDAQGASDDASLSPTLKYSEISSDQYFNLEHSQGNRLLAEIPLFPQSTTEVKQKRSSSMGDDKDTTNEDHAQDHHVVMNGNNPATQATYHLRSQGTQTIHSGKMGRRYAKKQMSRTSSNSYKEKVEAIKKRSSSTGPKSPTSAGSSSGGNVPHPTPRSPVGLGVRQSRSSVADSNASQSSQSVKRTLSLGSTTVIKPIENVYAGRSARRVNSGRNRRPINLIIYSPSPPSHAT